MLALAIMLAAWSASGCRAEQQGWPLWDAYAQRFVDVQGRVIDHSAADHTTSEGQAYGLFFALVANDRARFDKMLGWTETNLASGDLTLHLPSWNWGKNAAGEWKTLDPSSATDADLWLAYTLLEAGRLWQEPRYAKLGQMLVSRIAQQEVVEVPNFGTTLMAGPSGFHPDAKTWITNPSYFPLPVLTYLAVTMPKGPWSMVKTSFPSLVTGGTSSGYAMDWVAVTASGLKPVVSSAMQGSHTEKPVGSYDAIRVYLWAGISDPATPGLKQLFGQLGGMSGYMRGALTPPLEVDATGKVLQADSPPGFSAAVIPFLESLGMKEQAKVQADRLAATRDTGTGLYGHGVDYYDQNLALFSVGWSEGRYRFDRDGRLQLKWKR